MYEIYIQINNATNYKFIWIRRPTLGPMTRAKRKTRRGDTKPRLAWGETYIVYFLYMYTWLSLYNITQIRLCAGGLLRLTYESRGENFALDFSCEVAFFVRFARDGTSHDSGLATIIHRPNVSSERFHTQHDV